MRANVTIGWFGEDVVSAVEDAVSAVGDAASSVVNTISDAGKAIGAVLKFIAPIVALYPGIGTGVSVALSAAAAYASGDAIADAIVDTVSAAIPGGLPRAAFIAAADITRTAVEGGSVKDAAIASCRTVANSLGGERAVAAFDTGLAVARGDKVQGSMWKLARGSAANGGPSSVAAFDAAYAIAQGGDATDAALAAARAYLGGSGGPLALAAFDAGVAVSRGKSLQDAGFAALSAFAEGNDLAERALAFADKMARAARRHQPLERVLVQELEEDVAKYGQALARSGAGEGLKAFVASKLGPILDAWPSVVSVGGIPIPIDDVGSYVLGDLLHVDEVIARAAQAIMRNVHKGGAPDAALAARLMTTGVASAIEKFGAAAVASRATNATWTETKATIRSEQLELVARMPVRALSYATARAEQGLAPLPPMPSFVADVATVAAPSSPSSPSSPRTGTAGDVALGATIAAAIAALVWWSTTD